jgi:hypothetical protein
MSEKGGAMSAHVTADDLKQLATKLGELDLTNAERAILDAILSRAIGAGDDEVAGFVYDERGPRSETRVYEPGPTPESLADAAGVRHVL